MTAPFPSPGDSIGRFRVVAQLGAGGMGVVYDALEVNLDRRVALKVISPLFADDPDFRDRFSREARALASLDSPNVVQVYAHGEEDGYLYIATQLVPDGDLGATITRWGPAPLGKAAELIDQVAAGLRDAHAAGLVHRDIKPANVLVRRRGSDTVQAYLGDFGIARRVDAEVTRIGSVVVGTPTYMAPELHAGAHASASTDIYSLGCLLWVVLTGRPPYEGTTEFEVVGGHMSKPVPQLPAVSPLAEALNRVLRISMAKEPGHRYRTAQALRDDLRECLQLDHDPAYHRLATALGVAAGDGPARAAAARVVRTPTPADAARPAATAPAAASPVFPPLPPSTARARGSRRPLWYVGAAAATAVAVGGVTALVLEMGGRSAEAQEFLDSGADDIILAAEKDMRVLDSVRLSGTVDQPDGRQGGIDMVITSVGDCDGEIRIGDGVAEIRRIDGDAWLRPDETFLAEGGQAGELGGRALKALIGDRWVPADAEQADEFGEFCDLDEVLEGDNTGGSETTKGAVSEIDGHEVVEVTETSGDDVTVAYVRIESPHYVVRVENEADNGSYDLSDFDEPFTADAPAADEVFDDENILGG